MRVYLVIVLTIIALLLQISFLPALRPFGIVPDLVLVLVIAVASGGPLAQAMIVAVSSGFVLDLASGSDFGLKTGLLAVAVILAAYARRSGFRLGLRLQISAITVVICTVAALIMTADVILSGGRVSATGVIGAWFGTTLITVVGALIIGPVCAFLARPHNSYGEIE